MAEHLVSNFQEDLSIWHDVKVRYVNYCSLRLDETGISGYIG